MTNYPEGIAFLGFARTRTMDNVYPRHRCDNCRSARIASTCVLMRPHARRIATGVPPDLRVPARVRALISGGRVVRIYNNTLLMYNPA